MFYTIESVTSIDGDGQRASLFVTGTLTYSIVVIIANLEIIYSTSTHTIFSTIFAFGSIASFYIVYAIENKMSFIP